MEEYNRDILKKVIANLPVFKQPELLDWKAIEEEISKTKQEINNSDKLPTYSAPDKLWPKIEASLDSCEDESNKDNLPKHKVNYIRKVSNSNYNSLAAKRILKYAASIVLVIGFSFAILQRSKFRDYSTISYSLETLEEVEIDYIETIGISEKLCKQHPIACSTPQFLELQNQLEETNTEIEKLQKILQNNNQQPLKYYYMLENRKVEIEKKMVRIVLET